MYLVLGALVFRALEEKNEKNQIEELKSIRSDFAQKIDGIVTGKVRKNWSHTLSVTKKNLMKDKIA